MPWRCSRAFRTTSRRSCSAHGADRAMIAGSRPRRPSQPLLESFSQRSAGQESSPFSRFRWKREVRCREQLPDAAANSG
jgi:hypothetical protein